MADLKYTMKNHNGTGWDTLLPKTVPEQVTGLQALLDIIEAIAKGASRAVTFDTLAQLDGWLAGTYTRLDGKTKADLQVGDNLYIKQLDVPDYWWGGDGKYELETAKVVFENASATANGLLTKELFVKLAGIADGATKVTTPADIGAATAAQGAKADTALQSVPFEDTAGNIKMAGTGAAGTSTKAARADHVHPAQTSVAGNAETATKLAAQKTFELTGGVTGSVNSDLSGNVSIAATQVANKSNQKVGVSKNSTTATGTRKQINFKDGSNVTVTVADNSTNDAVDVTIAATNTTYSAATTSAAGLMSAADKSKLDKVPVVTVGATAPTSPSVGDIWFDTNE